MTNPMSREIVSQLGDLFMNFTHPATSSRADFVRYRQACNDVADDMVTELLRKHTATMLRDMAASLQGIGRPSSLIGPIGLRDMADEFDPDGARPPQSSATQADPEWEYGFAAPIPGLMYVTSNELMADTMSAARPDEILYRRPLAEWTSAWQTPEDPT